MSSLTNLLVSIFILAWTGAFAYFMEWLTLSESLIATGLALMTTMAGHFYLEAMYSRRIKRGENQ